MVCGGEKELNFNAKGAKILAKYIPVAVASKKDDLGQMLPQSIIWDKTSVFPIERILHICHPEDLVTRYTVKGAGRQRYLFWNGADWRISSPFA